MAWQQPTIVERQQPELEVLVRRVVSALDTGGIQGRGSGVLADDPAVEVTFLLPEPDFQDLRQRLLAAAGPAGVRFRVTLRDVTAIDLDGGRT